MVASIPASAIVDINPNVIAVGGSSLTLSGLFLTNSTRVPTGTVAGFSTASDVSSYFGPSSTEYTLALIYFAGFDGSVLKPARMLFAQYPTVAVPAYLRGGVPLPLAQLTPLSGVITLTIDGIAVTSSTITLSTASSMSDVAALIQSGIAGFSTTFTGQIASNILTVTATGTGTISVGQSLSAAAGAVVPGTIITGLGTGTGGTGTYTVSIAQSTASQTISAGPRSVVYDSVSGAFVITGGQPSAAGSITVASGSLATALGLTAAAGAVTSQGAAIATPAGAMTTVTGQTQNFATFMTMFVPSSSDKVAFATWADGQDYRFAYIMPDSTAAAAVVPDTTSPGALIRAANLSGTVPIYETGLTKGAGLMGAIASINFEQTNGRETLAFKSFTGVTPNVVSKSVADNLIFNGYNFYGAYASAANGWNFFYPGQITGKFLWIDSFVNQIKLNDGLQVALMNLLTTAGSVPFNADGYGQVEAAMLDPITEAVNFGSIRAGVTLSNEQRAEINAAAGKQIADTVQNRGWYVSVAPASPTVRAARGPLQVTLFYADGQAVHRIVATSDLVQ